jgi:hypothetical protein
MKNVEMNPSRKTQLEPIVKYAPQSSLHSCAPSPSMHIFSDAIIAIKDTGSPVSIENKTYGAHLNEFVQDVQDVAIRRVIKSSPNPTDRRRPILPYVQGVSNKLSSSS